MLFSFFNLRSIFSIIQVVSCLLSKMSETVQNPEVLRLQGYKTEKKGTPPHI